MKTERRGFTMIELMVVIGVMLILASMTYAMLATGKNTGKIREAARLTQSALLGAKDRAMHAKDLRGVRFVRDQTDNTLVTAFIYLQPLPTQTTGNLTGQPNQNNFALDRPNLTATPPNSDATRIVINGPQGAAWLNQDTNRIWPSNRVQIRIPSATGQWFNLAVQSGTAPYWIVQDPNNPAQVFMYLQTPYQGGLPYPPITNTAALPFNGANSSCDIQLGNDVLPFHAPISLPSGVVIDLKFCSSNVQLLAGVGAVGTPPYFDLMFSPRGMLTGPIAAQGPLHFLVRDLQDATATSAIRDSAGNLCGGFIVGPDPRGAAGWGSQDPNKSDRLILTVFPQSGLISTFEVDVTDNVNNQTGVAPPDGLADNPFNFALQGKSAGR
jgi:prepilin-type N-terminal cleavage/methylation domain-containing protein